MKKSMLVRASLLLAALLFAGSAFAQSSLPRRTDPGTPPEDGGGGSAWSTVHITGQSPGSTLGSLAADAAGGVYVWSVVTRLQTVSSNAIVPRETPPVDPAPEGGGSPQPPGSNLTVSTLYFYNGIVWTPSLQVAGETGATVFVDGSGEIYAATNLPDGSVHAYVNDGTGWRLEALPTAVHGPAGQIAGDKTIFFRTGGAVLRHTGNHWTVDFSCPNLGMSGGLVSLARDQMIAPCVGGVHLFDGSHWSWNAESSPVHVNAAWGARDANGVLHLFAASSSMENKQLEIYQYLESQQGLLVGDFQCVVEHPDEATALLGSQANRVWGSQVHDVYVTGVVDGFAHLFHFDGAVWRDIIPEPIRAAAIDVVGDATGAVWVSLANGNLLMRAGTSVPAMGRAALPTPMGNTGRGMTTMMVSSVTGGMHTISFSLPGEQAVSLAVFDLAGRRVETLVRDRLSAGAHQVTWNAKNVPNGMYFCRLETGSLIATRRMVVSR